MPKTSSEMARYYWLLGGVAVLGVAIVGYAVTSRGGGSAVTAPVAIEVSDPARLKDLARPVTRGDDNAPLVITEFGDFQCPFCAAFERELMPQIDAEFIRTGRAKFVFYDFPLVSIHPNAFLAARAARCAEDQGRFWQFHDALYRAQDGWASTANPVTIFEGYATQLGLDEDDYSSCLRSDRHADLVTAGMRLATQMQAPGTPTLFVTQRTGIGRHVDNTIESIREAVVEFESAR